MWHKAEWMGRPMRLELTRVSLLVKLANRYTTRGALDPSNITQMLYVAVNIQYYPSLTKFTLFWRLLSWSKFDKRLENGTHSETLLPVLVVLQC